MNPTLNLEEKFCEYLKEKDKRIWVWIITHYYTHSTMKNIIEWKDSQQTHSHKEEKSANYKVNNKRISVKCLLRSEILLIFRTLLQYSVFLIGSNPQYIAKCLLNT